MKFNRHSFAMVMAVFSRFKDRLTQSQMITFSHLFEAVSCISFLLLKCWRELDAFAQGSRFKELHFGSVEMQCFLKSSAKGNLWCFCILRWKGVVDEGSCVCDVVIHVWKPSIQRSSEPSRIQIAEEQWSGSLHDTEKVAFSFEKMEAWSLTMPRYLHSAVRIVLSMMAPLSNLVIQVNAAIGTRMDLITLGRDSVICIWEPEGKRFCLNSKVFGLYL